MTANTAPPFNTIRTYALVATAVNSIFSMGISVALIAILSGAHWCDQAIGVAADAGARAQPAIEACFSLMEQQVSGLVIALLISIGTLALCLSVLVVIVIAGGRLSFKGGPTGVEANMSSANDAPAAAAQVAEAAKDEADDIAQHGPRRPRRFPDEDLGRRRPDDPDGGR